QFLIRWARSRSPAGSTETASVGRKPQSPHLQGADGTYAGGTLPDKVEAMNQKAKAELFRSLHAGPEILVLPNAWDAISARIVESEGFPAVATSSAGVAAV